MTMVDKTGKKIGPENLPNEEQEKPVEPVNEKTEVKESE